MPGLIAFGRRWAFGSDDLIVPAVIFACGNFAWLILWLCYLPYFVRHRNDTTSHLLIFIQDVVFSAFLLFCVFLEVSIAYISTRGSVFEDSPRKPITYFLGCRIACFGLQILCSFSGIIWLVKFSKELLKGKALVFGMVVWQLSSVLIVSLILWCTWDRTGRRTVRLKKLEKSVGEEKRAYKRSGNWRRNWRRRRIHMIQQSHWKRRCRLLCCCLCVRVSDKTSFAEIAQLFSDFFMETDLVPTDIIAGLSLLRRGQKSKRKINIEQTVSRQFEYLSGAKVSQQTRFLNMRNMDDAELISNAHYFMKYSLAAYGWPFFVHYRSAAETCSLFCHLKCCSCLRGDQSVDSSVEVQKDNCCMCHVAAVKQTLPSQNIDLVYVSFLSDVGKSPFYVAIDHDKKAVVICVRGTLSLKDFLTDLTAYAEEIPVNCTISRRFLGHKGAIKTAQYLLNSIQKENLINRAYSRCGPAYNLMLVGHSLGGATAVMLSFLLRQQYPTLHCFCFSPPGGLLTYSAMEYSKEFVTTVVVGKDLVPRLGVAQMEALRSDLISALRQCPETKWKILLRSMPYCPMGSTDFVGDNSDVEGKSQDFVDIPLTSSDSQAQSHSSSSHKPANVTHSVSQPMYPPGQIVHIVRSWNKRSRKRKKPIWTAFWADNESFDKLLISPVMIRDHMPDGVLDALSSLPVPQYAVQSPQMDDNYNLQPDEAPLHAPLAQSEKSDIPIHTESMLGLLSMEQIDLRSRYENVTSLVDRKARDENEPIFEAQSDEGDTSENALASDSLTPSGTLYEIPSSFRSLSAIPEASTSRDDALESDTGSLLLQTPEMLRKIELNNGVERCNSDDHSKACSTIPEMPEVTLSSLENVYL